MKKEDAAAGQVSESAAEIYDRFFVPALFGAWAEPLCHAAGIEEGQKVLDVACGTGATTRLASVRVGENGAVVGLDRNDGMLAVAKAREPALTWIHGRAETLPFDDQSFNAVLCQFGLMFFDDPVAALKEMRRVICPGGSLAVSVWDQAKYSPGYAAMIVLLQDVFGDDAANALRAPFILGDKDDLLSEFDDADLQGVKIRTQSGMAHFPSIREWVRLDIRGWTLSDMIDDREFEELVERAENDLARFAGPDGTVSFAAPAHIVTWAAAP